MNNTKWIVGLDYSMSCPAITVVKDGNFTFDQCQFYYLSEKVEKNILPNVSSTRLVQYSNNEERFDLISNWAIHHILFSTLQEKGEVKVFIEDYSYGSKGKVFHIAENCGIVKHKLYKAGFSIHPIPPTVIKKHATGVGNATKDRMYEAFVLRTGIKLQPLYQPKAKTVGSPVGDIVDSYYVALCGYEGMV